MADKVKIDSWQRLKGKISPEILIAPKTGADPKGKDSQVHERIIRYIENNVIGKPWSDHLVLIAAIKVARRIDVQTIIGTLTSINCRFLSIFHELNIQKMTDWEAEKYIPLYLRGELVQNDSQVVRWEFWSSYISAVRQTLRWQRSLPKADQRVYQPFILPLVALEYVEGLIDRKAIQQKQRQKRKEETDALMPHYPLIRAQSHLRYNKIFRLRQKWHEALEKIKANPYKLPFTFSYIEGVEKLSFRVWDRRSFVLAHQDRYEQATVNKAKEHREAFSDEKNTIFLEFLKTERLQGDAPTEGLWFEEMLKLGVLGGSSRCSNRNIKARRAEWYQAWGYIEASQKSHDTPFRASVSGVLNLPQRDAVFMFTAQERAQGVLFLVEPLYVAATFGLLGIDIITTTGMRINELMQISLSEEDFKVIPIPPGINGKSPKYRYAFQLIPKGERTNQKYQYFIGEQTKNILVKVAKLLEEHYKICIDQEEVIPEVGFDVNNPRSHRFDKAPYLFQYNYRHLDARSITSCMRFLLHGMAFKTQGGKNVVIKAHLLRHSFATHAVQVEKIPIDIVAAWLKQKNLDVTKYYSQPTDSMVAEASDFYLASIAGHIDIDESVVRSPEEMETQRLEALNRVGTLNQVNGGDCTFHGFCKHGFSCNGCPHKVPDPAKRYQVEQKLEWARAELAFGLKEGLLPEVERYKQLIRACESELLEMNLIKQYQEDEKYVPQLQIEDFPARTSPTSSKDL